MKGFEDKNWNWWIFQIKFALKNACPQVFHMMTKMERAESEDAMVEVATLEATSATAKDDALTIIQGITNLNGFEAWRRKVARYAPTNPATVAVMRVMSPQRPNRRKELGSANGTWELQLNALAKDHDESLPPGRAAAAERHPGQSVPGYGHCQHVRGGA